VRAIYSINSFFGSIENYKGFSLISSLAILPTCDGFSSISVFIKSNSLAIRILVIVYVFAFLSPTYLEVCQEYLDAFTLSLRVIRRKTWCKKGKRKKVRGDRRKGRVNVMGGLRYSDKKKFIEFLEKGNADNFYNVLKSFYQELIHEWVEAGNQAKDFAEKGAKIVIILDNASFHKKEEYIERIEAEMPNLHLEFLPEYSPDYNLIELVWHSAKEYVANRLFKSIEELEYLLHYLLNEGELVIKWGRKIKNKGDALITV
jgi:transposase